MIAITGASGFIGSRLDDKISAVNVAHENIFRGDFADYDRIFFLSTYGNMSHHQSYAMMVEANVQDLLNVLYGYKGWFCFMSSSSITLPVQTPYSRTKRAAEEILQALPELKSVIVRPYSVTGVGEQKEHLIPTLIRSCMKGEPMVFNPYPVHDFVDVEDVVEGLMTLADNQTTGIIEFGNGLPITNQHVKELVEHVCGKKANAKSVSDKLRPYDTSSWYCRVKHPLWKPKKKLVQSIHEMVEAYKDEHT